MSDGPGAVPFPYDAIAYPSPVNRGQTPDAIAAAGLLYGFEAPDPLTASVLEIGCGDGLNLIAGAAVAPRSRCVGFDLSEPAIERGRALAIEAGIGNVDLHRGDILTYPRDGERFDYITCHGCHSWVPMQVRTALMELVGARLAPGGVAYVSFDCRPAATPKMFINAFLRARVADIPDAREQVRVALRVAETLARNQGGPSALKTALDGLLDLRTRWSEAYFFHDWLAPAYRPVTLQDFAREAAGVGLEVAGDVGMFDLFTGFLDEEARRMLAATPVLSDRFSLGDYLHGDRTFRRTLLVRRDAPPPRASDPLRRLRFGFDGEAVGEDGGGIKYATPEGAALTMRTPMEIRVMELFRAEAPDELTFEAILAQTGADAAELEALLRNAAYVGLVACYATPQNFVRTPGERPRAGRLIRAMLAEGDTAINQRHVEEKNYDTTRLFLMLCDGTRTRAELAKELGGYAGAEIPQAVIDATIADLAGHRVFEA